MMFMLRKLRFAIHTLCRLLLSSRSCFIAICSVLSGASSFKLPALFVEDMAVMSWIPLFCRSVIFLDHIVQDFSRTLLRSQGDIYSGLAGEFPVDQTSSRFSCAGPDRKSNMQYMRALFVSEEAGEEAQGKMGDLMSKHTKKSERRSHGPRMVGLAGSEVSKVQLFAATFLPTALTSSGFFHSFSSTYWSNIKAQEMSTKA